MVFQFVLYLLTAYMLISFFVSNKRQKKNRVLIDVVNSVVDKDLFVEKVNQMIDTINDKEFEMKGRVLKLWGLSYHNDFSQFEEVLNSIDCLQLMKKTKEGDYSIDMNEDSFFYLYMAIPEILHYKGRDDLRELLENYMKQYDEILNDQMVRHIGIHLNEFYENTADKGLSFYEKVLEGDYGEFIYSKTMIGLYKNIVNAMACKIYQETGNQEKFNESIGMVREFSTVGVGSRWLENLHIEMEEEKSEPEELQFEIVEDQKEDEE